MTPPGLGFLYRLLVLGGVERGWDVELPEDLGFSARVWATSRPWVKPWILPWVLDSRPMAWNLTLGMSRRRGWAWGGAWASSYWVRDGRLDLYGDRRSC